MVSSWWGDYLFRLWLVNIRHQAVIQCHKNGCWNVGTWPPEKTCNWEAYTISDPGTLKWWICLNAIHETVMCMISQTQPFRGTTLVFNLLAPIALLTHWGRVTHICVSKLTIISPDNGLSPGRRQTIIWTNAGILLIGPLGTSFSEILIEIHEFPFKKLHLKMSSRERQPFCLGLNVSTSVSSVFEGQWVSGAWISKFCLLYIEYCGITTGCN